jgi:hypothetical protein
VIGHKQIDDAKALLALQLLVEGNSVRSTQRITGLEKRTILKLVLMAGGRCGNLLATKVKGVPAVVEGASQVWSLANSLPVCDRGRRQEMEEGIVSSEYRSSKTRLFRTFQLSARQVLCLFEQVVRKCHRVRTKIFP